MLILNHQLSENIPFDFNLLCGLNRIDGVTTKFMFGHNADVDIDTLPEDLWEGGSTYTFLTEPATLSVVSNSASDTSNGTGARKVRIECLDSNYNTVFQDITLNGLTPVNLTGSLLRVQSMNVIESGTNQHNIGTITVNVASGIHSGAIQAIILPDHSTSHQVIYTVPNNKKFAITQMLGFVRRPVGTENVEVSLMVMFPGTNTWVNAFHLLATTTGSSVSSITSSPAMVVIPEHSDIKMQATYVSANNTGVQGLIQGYLIDNEQGE